SFGMFLQAFYLDDQHSFSVLGQSHWRPALNGFDGCPIHDFQGRRNNAGPSYSDDGFSRIVHLVKHAEQCPHRLAAGCQFNDDLGNDSHGAFRADEDTAKIVTGSIRNFTTQPDNSSVVEHDFDTKYVIGGYPVGKGVRAAGVVGDIAADGAGGLTAWVGSIEQTVLGD